MDNTNTWESRYLSFIVAKVLRISTLVFTFVIKVDCGIVGGKEYISVVNVI